MIKQLDYNNKSIIVRSDKFFNSVVDTKELGDDLSIYATKDRVIILGNENISDRAIMHKLNNIEIVYLDRVAIMDEPTEDEILKDLLGITDDKPLLNMIKAEGFEDNRRKKVYKTIIINDNNEKNKKQDKDVFLNDSVDGTERINVSHIISIMLLSGLKEFDYKEYGILFSMLTSERNFTFIIEDTRCNHSFILNNATEMNLPQLSI